MATQKLYVTKAAYVDQANPTTYYGASASTWYDIYGLVGDLEDKRLYLAFDAMPDSLKHNSITNVSITLRAKGGYLAYPYFYFTACEDFDSTALTYKTVPESIGPNIHCSLSGTYYSFADQDVTDDASNLNAADLRQFIQAAAYYAHYTNSINDSGYCDVRYGLIAGTNSYLTVTYDAGTLQTSQITYKSGPSSGYSNPRNATTFQWTYEPASSAIVCADESFEQTSATFYWKSSSDANYTSVAISNSTTSVTIAANTFPTAETISWYVEGTDEDGTTTQTSVFSFSTTAADIVATCVAPVNAVIDGSEDYTFEWTLASDDAQEASHVRVQWQLASEDPDTGTYTDICNVFSHITSYTVAGGTFPAGEIRWRVRAWNIDSSPAEKVYATFICVAAPDAPSGLAATEFPFSTISWQSSGQQAYEISIDGTVVKKAFGADVYSWTVENPLSDGNHVISVRIQGAYGYWSQASSVTITVANVPDTTLTLTGMFSTDADLTWDSSTYTTYVYRDGVRIGESDALSYTDRRALGSHTYYVEQWIGDGNYNRSNTVTGTMSVSCKMIAPIDGSASWLKLKLSENSYDSDGYTWSITNTSQHVLGAVYPQLEVSTFEKRAGTYNVAFTTETEIARFETLQGKVVILKSKGNNVITGLLGTVSKKVGVFYTAFTFSIQQIDVEDYEEQ